MGDIREVIIIGSGPTGYTAAIYAARASLEPLVFTGAVDAGGALMNTTEVENFPGFPEGIQGPDLMFAMQQQAERFGADVRMKDVTDLELDGEVKRVHVGDEVLEQFSDLDGVAEDRMLDLPAVARRLLERAGVTDIETADMCTSCNPELFYSHRRDGERTGRQAGLAWLES